MSKYQHDLALKTYSLLLEDELATSKIGATIAEVVKLINTSRFVIHLEGDLGAGKTTLTRSIIRAFGYVGNVKSPTYTIVEPYQLGNINVYHFDLYRLADPEELEMMGIRDYFELKENTKTVSLIEWPSKGEGVLPPPDLLIRLSHIEDMSSSNRFDMRNISFYVYSENAVELLSYSLFA